MKKYLFIFSIVLPLIATLPINSQSLRIEFKKIAADPNYSKTTIFKIIQDKYGFIWFASSDGLVKFDGYSMKKYKNIPFDSNSIIANYVQALFVDYYDNICVGTKSGFSIFNPFTEKCINYRYDKKNVYSLSNNDVRSIVGDSVYLWIGTFGGGLNRFDYKSKTFTRYTKINSSLSENKITSLALENHDILWIGSLSGIFRYQIQNDQFINLKHDPSNVKSLISDYVNTISINSKGDLWAGTTDGLSHFNKNNLSFENYRNNKFDSLSLTHNNILCYLDYNDYYSFISTLNGGVNIFDKKNLSFIKLSSDKFDFQQRIETMFKDRNNNIWLASNNGILYIAHSNIKFNMLFRSENYFNTFLPRSINAIIEDKDKKIWCGTLEGLFCLNRDNFTYKKYDKSNYLSHNRILSLLEDHEKNLWIGTNGRGLIKWDRNINKFKFYDYNLSKPNALKDYSVLSIFEDKSFKIWIGTYNGLCTLDSNDVFKQYTYNPNDTTSISNNIITCISEDSDSNLWIGTMNGLNQLNNSRTKFHRFKNKPLNKSSINNSSVLTLYIDETADNKTIWIGTYGGGLNKLNVQQNSFSHYTEENGLSNGTVMGIIPDNNKNLWLITMSGLFKFNKISNQIKKYDINDGLLSNEFNQASYKNSDGEIMLGAQEGFMIFHPDSIKDNPHIPPIVLTSFKKFNQEVKLEKDINHIDELILNYDDYVFSFEYAALNYISPEKNQYAYWMEGFEKDWTYCGTRRYVSYTNLDPGDYVFHVKGSNNDGVWNETGKSLKIIITPPYYQTWWFRTLMVIFAGLVVVFVVQWRKYYKEYRKLRYISHFKIVRKLGEGGMGEVYQAKNFITGDSVALKLLHPRLTAEESNKTRFLREARLMSDLQHPNIVKIFETGEAAGRGYISMELLEGMTLSEFIKKSGYLSSSVAVEIALAACEALSFIHQQGVIHRDIKSENIFILQPPSKSKSRFRSLSKISQTRLTWPERVRLMDFGLAKSLELMTITQVESIIGTIAYMSPEQASGRAVDVRSDVYSLGVALYEALTGHLPHESDNELVLLQAVMDGRDPKPMETHGMEIPEAIKEIVMKMLKKYPDERYQSIEEVKDALRSVKGTEKGKSDKTITPTPSPKSLSRQSLVYLSKGDLSKAMEVSKTAIDNIKDVSGSDEAELYFNHYKVLTTAGQKDEAEQYMQKALSRVAESPVLAASQQGDKRILVEYNTQKWKRHYQSALRFREEGNISEARLELLDAIALIKQSLLIIDDDQEKSYYTEANNVNDVIQMMHQLMN